MLADRWDRRKLVMVIQVAMVVVALVFGFLIANGKIDSIWHIYGYMMVSGITHSFV